MSSTTLDEFLLLNGIDVRGDRDTVDTQTAAEFTVLCRGDDLSRVKGEGHLVFAYNYIPTNPVEIQHDSP